MHPNINPPHKFKLPIFSITNWHTTPPSPMASMSFSSIFSPPLQSVALTKLHLITNSALPFIDSSNRSTLTSSKSTFFRDGFPVLSQFLSRFSIKSRSFASISARAATEKTIHDFTVKVPLSLTHTQLENAIQVHCGSVSC